MKKVILLIAITILLATACYAQETWRTYKIDDKLPVQLPSEPERKDQNNMAVAGPDSASYFITVFDVGDTARIARVLMNPEALKSALMKGIPGFTMGDLKRGKWKNFDCFTGEGNDEDVKMKLYFSLLIVGHKIYLLGNILPYNKPNKKPTAFLELLSLN